MLTDREWNVARAVTAQVRYELGDRAAPPGRGDAAFRGPAKVTPEEMRFLRQYIRAAVGGDPAGMRRIGGAA